MIFVGLGFRKAVTANSFENLFRQVLNLTELPGPIKALATLDTKALNPALQEFAAAKKVTLIPVSLENLPHFGRRPVGHGNADARSDLRTP